MAEGGAAKSPETCTARSAVAWVAGGPQIHGVPPKSRGITRRVTYLLLTASASEGRFMGLMDRARTALDAFMPGLDEFLASTALMELEGPHSKGIAAFRDHGGAALLVPAEHSGRGATAL